MKAAFLFILFFISLKSFGQDTARYSLQASISFNRTDVKDYNTNNGNGFGAAFNILTHKNKPAFFKFGIEFNKISLFKKYVYDGHFNNLSNVTYDYYYWSLPLSVGFRTGKKVILFFEAGGFLDLPLTSRLRGTDVSYAPIYSTHKISGKAGGQNVNFGTSLTIGVKLPVGKSSILICSTYRNGRSENSGDMGNVPIDRYIRLSLGWEWL